MEKFNYDKFEAYMMVALTSLASLAISTMLVLHLFTSAVGATSFLFELTLVVGSIYMMYIAYNDFKSLNK